MKSREPVRGGEGVEAKEEKEEENLKRAVNSSRKRHFKTSQNP